jgi:hypothetical protein
VRAARLEHEALDRIAAGEVAEGVARYREIFELLPDEVAYHVGAVRALARQGDDEARREMASLGAERARRLGPGSDSVAAAFATGFFASHLPTP